MAYHFAIRLSTSPFITNGLWNPVWGICSQKPAKLSETSLLPLLGDPQKDLAIQISHICREPRPVPYNISGSVFVSTCGPRFSFDVLYCFESYNSSSLSSADFPELSLMLGCAILHLFPSVARLMLSDDNWVSHQSDFPDAGLVPGGKGGLSQSCGPTYQWKQS